MKGFAPLLGEAGEAAVLFTDDDGEGRATCDPRYFHYTKLTRPLWPMVSDPHSEGVAEVPWGSSAADLETVTAPIAAL
eukprot:COSAG06_NODE_825_length_12067_cov_4.396975_3_plen_78_part_00